MVVLYKLCLKKGEVCELFSFGRHMHHMGESYMKFENSDSIQELNYLFECMVSQVHKG